MPAFFTFLTNVMMRAKNNQNCVLAAGILFVSVNCHAIDLHFAGELMYFEYEETGDDGSRLNKETGYIPGVSVAASQLYRGITHNIEYSFYGGDVDYDGQTQTGIPHQTRTDQRIYRLQYRFSGSLESTDADLYGKVYWQQWDRDIQPRNNVGGLFERYEWWSLEAGIEVPLMRRDRQDLLLELGILTTLNGTMTVDLSALGYGEPVLDLGNETGFSGELKYEIRPQQNTSLRFGLQFRTWEFGRSNTLVIIDGTALCGRSLCPIYEPASKTIQTVLSASYIHHF